MSGAVQSPGRLNEPERWQGVIARRVRMPANLRALIASTNSAPGATDEPSAPMTAASLRASANVWGMAKTGGGVGLGLTVVTLCTFYFVRWLKGTTISAWMLEPLAVLML